VKCDACQKKGHKAKDCEATDEDVVNRHGARFGDFQESNFNGGFQRYHVDPPQRQYEDEEETHRGRGSEGKFKEGEDSQKKGETKKRNQSSFN
jgi:hypothetical protein